MLLVALASAASLPEPDLTALREAATTRFLGDARGRHAWEVVEVNDAGVFGRGEVRATARAKLSGTTWSEVVVEASNVDEVSVSVNSDVQGVSVPFVAPMMGDTGALGDDAGSAGRALLGAAVRAVEGDQGIETAAVEVYEGREVYRLDSLLGTGWSLWRGKEENAAAAIVDPTSLRAREWRLRFMDPTRLEVGKPSRLEATLTVDAEVRPVPTRSLVWRGSPTLHASRQESQATARGASIAVSRNSAATPGTGTPLRRSP